MTRLRYMYIKKNNYNTRVRYRCGFLFQFLIEVVMRY